jgi:hypothetical protein
MDGICFRCWGSGEDPCTVDQLQAWLGKAREEYRNRLRALRDNPPPAAEKAIKADLKLIASMGKKNRARLDKLLQSCPRCETVSGPNPNPC